MAIGADVDSAAMLDLHIAIGSEQPDNIAYRLDIHCRFSSERTQWRQPVAIVATQNALPENRADLRRLRHKKYNTFQQLFQF
ncbi:hypothetical protein SDC9_139263 [bioreactor metagenome]|uniref:Uncharacterized protein n=1 Tax=bioreactor metagenome TaxID=1076179 RepID=A0A645DS77_9ZZZZ